MDFTAVDDIMGELRRVHFAAADKSTIITALACVQRLRGILDAIEIEAASRLNDLAHNAPPNSQPQHNDRATPATGSTHERQPSLRFPR